MCVCVCVDDRHQVSLFKFVDSNWVLIHESVTNADGRCAEFLQRDAFRSGRYKLHFDVEKYFKSIRTATIYPFIEVCIVPTVAHCHSLNFYCFSNSKFVLYFHSNRK